MTKAEYMELLKKNLEQFSKELQEEILEDYRQHFAEGENQGKTDEEIIRELGNIDEMIQGLSEVDGGNTYEAEKAQPVEKEKSYQYSGEYKTIELECDAADMKLEASEDGRIYVYYELDGSESYCRQFNFYRREEGDVLYAGLKGGDGKSKHFFGIDVNINWNGNKTYTSRFGNLGKGGGSAVLKVRIPAKMPCLVFTSGGGRIYANGLDVSVVKGRTGSGDLSVNSLSAGSLEVHAGSGDMEFRNISAAAAELSTGSGDMTVERLDAEALKMSTGSGDLEVSHIKVDAMEAATGSGDMELQEVTASACRFTTGSGDVQAQEVQAQVLGASTASGDVYLRNIRTGIENCQCQTASGDMELCFTGPVGRIDVCSSSGDIRLDLEEAGGMEATVNSKTGDVNISWKGERCKMRQGVYRYGDGSCKVNAKTTTGDVDIVGR